MIDSVLLKKLLCVAVVVTAMVPLGWLVYLASPSYRKRLSDNIARAGYARHRSAAIAESGKSILELAFVWCAPPQKVLRSASIEHWDLVQSALDARQGVIFLTPHLGFDLTGRNVRFIGVSI